MMASPFLRMKSKLSGPVQKVLRGLAPATSLASSLATLLLAHRPPALPTFFVSSDTPILTHPSGLCPMVSPHYPTWNVLLPPLVLLTGFVSRLFIWECGS